VNSGGKLRRPRCQGFLFTNGNEEKPASGIDTLFPESGLGETLLLEVDFKAMKRIEPGDEPSKEKQQPRRERQSSSRVLCVDVKEKVEGSLGRSKNRPRKTKPNQGLLNERKGAQRRGGEREEKTTPESDSTERYIGKKNRFTGVTNNSPPSQTEEGRAGNKVSACALNEGGEIGKKKRFSCSYSRGEKHRQRDFHSMKEGAATAQHGACIGEWSKPCRQERGASEKTSKRETSSEK